MTGDNNLFSVPERVQLCPLCQQPLVIKSGKSGPFLGCSSYPACDYLKPLQQHETSIVKLLETEACPLCQSVLAVKNGRYGMFIGCSNYPDCHFVVHEQEDIAEDSERFNCPQCQQGELVARVSKFGKHFYGCDRYPQCKFLLNDPPKAGHCVKCGFGLLLEKKGQCYCASKSCGEKQPVA